MFECMENKGNADNSMHFVFTHRIRTNHLADFGRLFVFRRNKIKYEKLYRLFNWYCWTDCFDFFLYFGEDTQFHCLTKENDVIRYSGVATDLGLPYSNSEKVFRQTYELKDNFVTKEMNIFFFLNVCSPNVELQSSRWSLQNLIIFSKF